MVKRKIDQPWLKIFEDYRLFEHDFEKQPYIISAQQIKIACQDFKTTGEKEVRVLCYQDTRENRPKVFKDNNLFLLPIKNGIYSIILGEGYVDIPKIEKTTDVYPSQLGFQLDTVKVGDSEMQHLDFAYASSLIRTFMDDISLVLTIRGRKYTPKFSFYVGNFYIEVVSVQTEVDAGYEGKTQLVLIEGKNTKHYNTIIRQLYYPMRQWSAHTNKNVKTLFFEKQGHQYSIWHFEFSDINNYNSIRLINSGKFNIIED